MPSCLPSSSLLVWDMGWTGIDGVSEADRDGGGGSSLLTSLIRPEPLIGGMSAMIPNGRFLYFNSMMYM